MSFASQLAASGDKPLYIAEFGGLPVDPDEFDSVSNWSAGTNVANLAADTDDARAGTGSIGWDKTGTASVESAVTNHQLAEWEMEGYASVWVRAPTTTAGTLSELHAELGQDSSNRWLWRVPAAFFAEGEWVRLRLSVEEYDDAYTGSLITVGSPTKTAIDWCRFNFRGTSSAYTHTGARVDLLARHPHRIASGKVTTPRADTKVWMMDWPQVTPHQYDPRTGRMGSAAATFEAVDGDESTLIESFDELVVPGTLCDIYAGFRGEDESDTNYERIFRGIVQQTARKGRGWSYKLSDNLQLLRRPIMQDATDDVPVTLGPANVIDLFLQLALSTGNGNNDSTYDVLSAVRGAGISRDLIDVVAFEAVRDDFGQNDDATWAFTESRSSLLDWYLAQVCRGYGYMPVITSDGLLSIRAVEAGVYPDASVTELGAGDILIDREPPFSTDRERIFNQVRVLYDWNSSTEEFDADSGDSHKLQASIDRYGVREMVIEARGITSATVAQRVAKRWLALLGDGAPPVEIDLDAEHLQIDMGSAVRLTSDKLIPDLDAGTYSITDKLGQVESRGFDPKTQRVRQRVGVVGYRLGNFRLIGPSALGDYDAQTDDEKATYGSIADTSGLLGTDDDDAHQIGP